MIADDSPLDPLNWFWADLLTAGTAGVASLDIDALSALANQAFDQLIAMTQNLTLQTLATILWDTGADLIESQGFEGLETVAEWVYDLEVAELDGIADVTYIELPSSVPTLILYPTLIIDYPTTIIVFWWYSF